MDTSFLGRVWAWVKWPLLVLVIAYAVLVGFRTKYLLDQDKTAEAVAKIHASKLTREDVFGALPPEPDPVANNATLAGVDVNNNGIRDDVERAIYEANKDSVQVAAAEFQYAKTQQMFLTNVYNTETWVAVAEEDSRASYCVSLTYPRDNLKKFNQVINERLDEVEALVFNTQARKDARDKVYEFATGYTLGGGNLQTCDVSVN